MNYLQDLSSSDSNDFINLDVEDERDMNEEIHDDEEDFQNRDGNFDQPNNNVENMLNDEVCNIVINLKYWKDNIIF